MPNPPTKEKAPCGGIAWRGEPGHLFAKHVDRPTRGDARNRVEMTGYGSRVGKEAVYGNQSRDARKNSEERVERDASGDQEDAIFRNTMIDAQKNVLPSLSRDLRRRLRGPATAGFKRPAITCRGARIPRPPPGKSECDQHGAQSDSP